MDIIFIHELRVSTLIGVYAWERKIPQTIQLDLEVAMPHSRSCQSDAIADTIDYSRIVSRIQEHLAERHFFLLERLAEEVAQLVMREFTTPWIKVSVAKLAPLRGVKWLGISIERGEKPTH